MKNEIICLSGSPCSGKGTQSELIKENYPDLIHISTGDLLREEVKSNSYLGRKILSYSKRGLLVPDEIIISLLNQNLDNNNQYLFDGFPRNLNQAELVSDEYNVRGIILLETNLETVLQRLKNRNEGRCDDNEETFRKRFEVFENETMPGIKYLKNKYPNNFYRIDASKTIPEVYQQTQKALELIL